MFLKEKKLLLFVLFITILKFAQIFAFNSEQNFGTFIIRKQDADNFKLKHGSYRKQGLELAKMFLDDVFNSDIFFAVFSRTIVSFFSSSLIKFPVWKISEEEIAYSFINFFCGKYLNANLERYDLRKKTYFVNAWKHSKIYENCNENNDKFLSKKLEDINHVEWTSQTGSSKRKIRIDNFYSIWTTNLNSGNNTSILVTAKTLFDIFNQPNSTISLSQKDYNFIQTTFLYFFLSVFVSFFQSSNNRFLIERIATDELFDYLKYVEKSPFYKLKLNTILFEYLLYQPEFAENCKKNQLMIYFDHLPNSLALTFDQDKFELLSEIKDKLKCKPSDDSFHSLQNNALLIYLQQIDKHISTNFTILSLWNGIKNKNIFNFSFRSCAFYMAVYEKFARKTDSGLFYELNNLHFNDKKFNKETDAKDIENKKTWKITKEMYFLIAILISAILILLTTFWNFFSNWFKPQSRVENLSFPSNPPSILLNETSLSNHIFILLIITVVFALAICFFRRFTRINKLRNSNNLNKS